MGSIGFVVLVWLIAQALPGEESPRITRPRRRVRKLGTVSSEEDIARIAAQLADLTRTVEAMAAQLKAVADRADDHQERADRQHERAEIQQERIDLAARELSDVSERLQAAANALRESL